MKKIKNSSSGFSLQISRPKLNFNPKKISFNKLTNFLRRHPVISFVVVLGILFLLILISNTLLKPKVSNTTLANAPKKVAVYTIGKAPRLTLQGQVEKSKVIKITALNAGVIQAINFNEGDSVSRGQTLVNMSTNYQGGNALAVSSQLAGVQLANINQTYDTQKDIIAKQRDLANKNSDNASQLRDIANQSINDTHGVIDLNNSIINNLNDQIGANATDPSTLQLRQLKSQFVSANLQLQSALKNNELTVDPNKAPSQTAEINKQIALKQLDVQEKGLELSRDVARLQFSLARISEATMFPSAPYAGTVERIHIKIGQAVTPGTVLMTLSGVNGNSNIYVKVPANLANSISKLETSTLRINNKTVDLYPDFISSEATDGQLYIVHFSLPDNFSANLADSSYVDVELPIGYPDTSSAVPFVPLDSIFQSQSNSYIFVMNKAKAESKEVKLGQVYGSFVQVLSGLNNGDQIILDRSVVAGDKVEKNGP